MSTAFDFAAQLQTRLPGLNRRRLMKLLYYVQAWSLVHRDRLAFAETFEAWIDGPVIRDLWADLEHQDSRQVSRARPLSPEDAVLVDEVLAQFGHLSAKQLVDMTHSDAPWREARRSLAPDQRSSAEISTDAIKAYYARAWQEAREDNERAAAPPAFTGTMDELEKFLAG